jgi:Arc/MetJ-type ribon-helix-helix transcriptional regulator
VYDLRSKSGESEKITINLGVIDLGQVDLLVQEGFYSNRTDFIRTAIRNQLSTHAEIVKQTVARRTLVLGLHRFTRAQLEAQLAAVKSSGFKCWGSPALRTMFPRNLHVLRSNQSLYWALYTRRRR